MKRIIAVMACMTLLFSIAAVDASATVTTNPVAAYVRNGISMASGTINGDVYLGGAFTANSATDNLKSGDIYKGPSGTVNFIVPSEFTGTTIDVKAATFPSATPALAVDTSTVPKNSTQDYVLGWWPLMPDLTTSWSFNSITVNNKLTIDTTAGDVVIVTNTLSGTGTIDVKGSNHVAIIVKNSISGNVRTESSVTQDNLYLFIQNGNYASPTYGNLAATIVMNSGVFTVDGSVTFNGVVMSNGTGTFIAKGSTTLNAQYYTPNADVQLVSGTTFNGMVEANSLVVSGHGKLNYGAGYVSLPTTFFGSSPTNPAMTLPDKIGSVDTHVQGLKAEYYDTISMANSSTKRLEKQVDSPDFNYQWGSPDPVIDPDTFSIKYTGYIKPAESGNYTFYTYSDDGVRLAVGGSVLVDRLEDMSLQFTKGTAISLDSSTYYPMELSYYENSQNATLFLFYEKDGGSLRSVPSSWYYSDETTATQYFNLVGASGNGLNINYYNSKVGATLGGTPDATSTGYVNMYLGAGSPDTGINNDNFSILFEGYLEPRYTEDLTLEFFVDDGIRVYIDDVLVIDKWSDHSEGDFTTVVKAVNGVKNKIRIEYYEGTGNAICCMFWKSDSLPRQVVPLKYLYSSN